MKKMYFAVLVVLLTFCTSCEFSETIYINDDGSGKLSMYLDGSELMPMMGTQMTGGQEQSIDSMISFKDMFKGNSKFISEISDTDRKMIKSLENLNAHMVLDTKKNKFNVDLFTDFKSVNDIQEMFGAVNSLAKIAKNSNAMGSGNPLTNTNIDKLTKMNYSYDTKTFKRALNIMDKGLMDKLKENLGQAEMLLAASTYKLNYHFPRKIKSVSDENAVMAEDGKSFSVKVNALEFVNNPEMLNLEVELEK
ncbi:hypothetical protein KORDIASMS9_00234 [Kordia sp. SMS9]|uniref:hypothetical protein n=1 Tax=Kordia sp. SMS9 TaxID=2282170 RepID=UPI000E0D2873|nr:hypothetical protein [Kordia sp. SMS9]AXG68045.1 hypothetical protein KORDIASMS9_00234 [Kordia sp. SMS9]